MISHHVCHCIVIAASSSELRVLSEVTTVATSKYEELRPPIQQLGTFYDNLTDKCEW